MGDTVENPYNLITVSSGDALPRRSPAKGFHFVGKPICDIFWVVPNLSRELCQPGIQSFQHCDPLCPDAQPFPFELGELCFDCRCRLSQFGFHIRLVMRTTRSGTTADTQTKLPA